MSSDQVYLVFGAGLLLAVVLPDLLSRWAVSAPMVLVGAGMLIGLSPLPDGFPLDPGRTGPPSSTSPSSPCWSR